VSVAVTELNSQETYHVQPCGVEDAIISKSIDSFAFTRASMRTLAAAKCHAKNLG
jgi:hypothetical protein